LATKQVAFNKHSFEFIPITEKLVKKLKTNFFSPKSIQGAKMNFSVSISILFFLSFGSCTVSNEKKTSMTDFYALLKWDNKQFPIPVKLEIPSDYSTFLINYYNSNPAGCLLEALQMNSSLFPKFFIEVISSKGKTRFKVDIKSRPETSAVYIWRSVKGLILNKLFEPFD
jgi:hypothetical protein